MVDMPMTHFREWSVKQFADWINARVNIAVQEATMELQDKLRIAEESDAESLALYRSARDRADELKADLARLQKAHDHQYEMAGLMLRDAERYAQIVAVFEKENGALKQKLQTYIGLVARKNLEMDIVESIVNDPEYEPTPLDMEYWNGIHDNIVNALRKE